ncbi:MAG: MATE family efflux transporter, partial [Candidatus Bipolaricaulis sp.]|nr:MATE family efflux transporter [Candidatus Bipolaricaulis sp.]
MRTLRFLRPFALHRDASRRVLALATPVVLGSLSYTLLSVVDTAMVGRLGAVALAATGVAGVLVFAVLYALGGMSVGVQALVARRFGEQDPRKCGEVLRSGLAVAILFGIPFVAAAPWIARFSAPLLSPDPEVAALGGVYLHNRFFGAAFSFLSWVYAAFFAGIGRTRHQLVSSILVTAVNITLDYLLIFGRGGFPTLGVAGAAIATNVAIAVGVAYYVVITLLPEYRRTYAPYRAPRSVGRWIRPLFRLSLPVHAQRALSHGSWFAFFLVTSRIGTLELAATNVMRSIYSLSIMLAVGMGTASAALVGQSLGARRPEDAERLASEAVKLAAYVMGAVGIVFIAAPQWMFRIYTSDPAVIAVGRTPLFYLGFVQALAGVALVLSQTLQGAGNTRFTLAVELVVCLGLYLPLAFFLGLRSRLGLVGAWTAEYAYWLALATIMATQFRRGTWKT